MPRLESEYLPARKLRKLKAIWQQPDAPKGETWDYDGVPHEIGRGEWMNYEFEFLEGLSLFGCTNFDELVALLATTLGRKPTVVDLMGGAYFLKEPEVAEQVVGIRVHDKDADFLEAYQGKNTRTSQLLSSIVASPNREVIEADILSNEGWRKIREAALPPADLLVCRPVGPFDTTKAMAFWLDNPGMYVGLYASLFSRMISLVNPQTGVVFAEAPDIFSTRDLKEFLAENDRVRGSTSDLFTVASEDYHWGGKKRRYAVIRMG